jgi:hypothetical protein
MANSPGQPEDFEFPGEFIPSPTSQDCSKKAGGWGVPMTDYEYIWYANAGEDDYPKDACKPYYHKAAQIDNFKVNVLLDGAASLNLTGTGTFGGEVAAPTFRGNFVGNLTGTASGNKGFDIPHVKDGGKRIRHICVEGPESGIYVRGSLKDANEIVLPEYWDGLVDPETITVTLTQIGYSQDLIVDKIEWGKIVRIRSGNGANINCFYEVWAARHINPMNHDEKLHVVYEGNSPKDYPGNNEYYLLGGWDYDRRETKWRRPEDEIDSVNLDKGA